MTFKKGCMSFRKSDRYLQLQQCLVGGGTFRLFKILYQLSQYLSCLPGIVMLRLTTIYDDRKADRFVPHQMRQKSGLNF